MLRFSFFRFAALLLLLTGAVVPSVAQSTALPSSLFRKYTEGEKLHYRLITNVIYNGKWQSQIVAECELITGKDDKGIPYEEIKWLSKKQFTASDTTDRSEEIQKVHPYRISLHPDGRLDLPRIEVASATGEITDLNTFFVAVGPKAGIAQLHHPGDRFEKEEPVKGNFGNGKDILKGEDCLQLNSLFLKESESDAILKTDFLPPSKACLNWFTADLQTPVSADTINNFQMVRASAGGKVNVFSGKEYFTIYSLIQKKTGILTKASMINELTLRLKVNCNEELNGCQTTLPFAIKRTLELQLVN